MLIRNKLSKGIISGVILIMLSYASYIAEKIFYDYIDENGVVQESLFLPLTFILGFIGLAFLVVGVVSFLIKGGTALGAGQRKL